MAFWRPMTMTRLRFQWPAPIFIQLRFTKKLSSSATIGALRAFYLSVHPDFFAQHPKMQKVNESSLKRLNNYLEALQCTRQIKNLEPTKVTFYFRRESESTVQKSNDFKLVNFTLRSHDVMTNIEHILNSCGLPMAHLERVAQQEAERQQELPLHQRYRKTSPDTTVRWHEHFYDNEQKNEDSVSTTSLRKWLRKNAHDISAQQESSRSMRESNEALKNDICLNFGLREIVWCSPWQYWSEQGILRNFARFCTQNKDQVQSLRGKRLIFSDRTMASADESICLNVEDVPQQSLQFLSKFSEKFYQSFQNARHLDNIVCENCGNIKVVRPKVRMSRFREHSLVSIAEYLTILKTFTSKLQSLPPDKNLKILPWSLRNHELTFASLQDSEDDKITMFSNGRLRVDGNCDPRHLLSFLLQNKISMEEKKYLNASSRARSKQLVDFCKEKFGIWTLTKDFDVTNEQMSTCCERLLQNSAEFNILLNGLELRITSDYYSTFDHGHFCIPWNWKN